MNAVSTSFEAGCCFRMKGKWYSVESSRGRTRWLVDHDSQELVAHRIDELILAYLDKDLEFIDLTETSARARPVSPTRALRLDRRRRASAHDIAWLNVMVDDSRKGGRS